MACISYPYHINCRGYRFINFDDIKSNEIATPFPIFNPFGTLAIVLTSIYRRSKHFSIEQRFTKPDTETIKFRVTRYNDDVYCRYIGLRNLSNL